MCPIAAIAHIEVTSKNTYVLWASFDKSKHSLLFDNEAEEISVKKEK